MVTEPDAMFVFINFGGRNGLNTLECRVSPVVCVEELFWSLSGLVRLGKSSDTPTAVLDFLGDGVIAYEESFSCDHWS